MSGTAHLKEPSVPFKIVSEITVTYDDGSTDVISSAPLPTGSPFASIAGNVGLVSVNGTLIDKTTFNAQYDVDGQTTPLA